MKSYRFEAIVWVPDDWDPPTENDLDMGPLYHGTKHSEYIIDVEPGTIREVK